LPYDRVALAYYVNPTVVRGHVRVRVKAAGIGFVDALKIAGRYQTKDALPFVPGMEFSGTVDEAGEDVTQLKVGDRVFGSAPCGALAEEISVAAGELSKIPDHVSFVQAAAVPVNYLTAAYGLIELAALRAGQNLLSLGAAGGTGTAAIKLAG
jgi:NADPH:quinone reductase